MVLRSAIPLRAFVLRMVDSTGRTPGEIVEVGGILGDADIPNPPGLYIQSAIPNRGTILWIVANGSPGKDADNGLLVYGTGPGMYYWGPHTYLKITYNYGPDGKPQSFAIGEAIENGGVGVPGFIGANGQTTFKLCTDGTGEIFNALRASDGGNGYLVEIGTQGLRLWAAGAWRHVEIGPNDSGGVGYRALRTPNW